MGLVTGGFLMTKSSYALQGAPTQARPPETEHFHPSRTASQTPPATRSPLPGRAS